MENNYNYIKLDCCPDMLYLLAVFESLTVLISSWDNVVCLITCHGLDSLGFEPQWG